jgi:RsiW-degrading membrane proteinase PrsW (M82 family)
MEFKPLEIKSRGNLFKRVMRTPHLRRTAVAILTGAVIGFVVFYFTEGRSMDAIPAGDVLKSILIGGFFGFFVTNSPCARGRC